MADRVQSVPGDGPDPAPALALVRRTARELRVSWIVTGVALTVAWLAGTLAAAAGVDMTFALPAPLRGAAWLLVVGPTAFVAATRLVWPAARRLQASRVARRIESHLPGMHNRLVSCVDIASGVRRPRSTAFYYRLVSETLERIRKFRPREIVDRRGLCRAGAAAAASLLAVGLLLAAAPLRMRTAAARVLVPFADIPPVSDVSFWVHPGSAKLLRGDDLTFRVHVTAGEPRRLELRMWTLEGAPDRFRYAMQRRTDGRWTFTLSGFERTFTYRVVGGGTWTPAYRVDVLERPEIADLSTVLHYPAYMALTNTVAVAGRQGEVAGPSGSRFEVVVRTRGDVAEGAIEWLRAGSGRLVGDRATNDVFEVERTLRMTPDPDGRWSGFVPLTASGLYRVRLVDELGHASKPMRPARCTALPDLAPQVVVQQPGTEVNAGADTRLPVVIAAYDDYGLSNVTVSVEREHGGARKEYGRRTFPRPRQSETVPFVLDLASMGVRPGDRLRYRAAATDRKGQVTASAVFSVSVVDRSAEEARLAAFDAQRAEMTASLEAMWQRQQTVHTRVSALATNYARLGREIRTARSNLLVSAETPWSVETWTPTGFLDRVLGPATNAAAQAGLASLRTELGELAVSQRENVELADTWLEDMKTLTRDASALPWLPDAMARQLRSLSRAFRQTVREPAEGLAAAMEAGSSAEEVPPDLDELRARSAELADGVRSAADGLESLDELPQWMEQEPAEVMERMEQALMLTRAEMMSRDLRELERSLSQLASELNVWERRQERMLERTREAAAPSLASLEARQEEFERQTEPALDTVRDLQREAAVRPEPVFPEAPVAPEFETYDVPPAEEDPPEPVPNGMDRTRTPAAGETDDEERPLYAPVLGGPQPRLDPRFADKRRPVEPGEEEASEGSAGQRQELADRQWGRLSELNLARQSVSSDRQAVGALSDRLRQTMRGAAAGEPRAARPSGLRGLFSRRARADTSAPDLAGTMGSEDVQAALSMAQRMAGARARQQGRGGQRGLLSSMMARLFGPGGGGGGSYGEAGKEEEMSHLDLETRGVILGMQPRVREELLEGMKEEGPAAYRELIRRYFSRLTRQEREE